MCYQRNIFWAKDWKMWMRNVIVVMLQMKPHNIFFGMVNQQDGLGRTLEIGGTFSEF